MIAPILRRELRAGGHNRPRSDGNRVTLPTYAQKAHACKKRFERSYK